MKLLLPALLAPVALWAGTDLSTQYSTDRVVVVESTLKMDTEVTNNEILIDGQPPEGDRFGGGEQTTSMTRTLVMADRVVEGGEGGPTKVHREFRDLGGNTSMSAGERESDNAMESPLSGVTLELVLEDGDVQASVADGDSQEDAQLAGHSMTLDLDALLPDGEVDEGDSWEIEKDAISRVLGIQMHSVLFPRPERGEGGGQRGERGGGGGGRGRGGRGGGGGGLTELMAVDWEGEATLSGTEEHEGEECHVIELKLEASGELPEQERGGGRRRDRMASPAVALAPWIGTSLEVELEGRLLVSVANRRPVHLALKGEMTKDMERTMDRGERTMEMSRTTEGTIEFEVQVTQESAE